MPAFIDLTDCRFSRLTVISLLAVMKHGKSTWQCLCDCGNSASVTTSALRSGNTKSCGCIYREMVIARTEESKKHAVYSTAAYKSWASMKERCYSKSHKSYKDYGGRGITVCQRWLNFHNFLADMGERPEGTTLDRKDNSQRYSPRNCRWATSAQQGNNKRSNRMLTFKGRTLTTAEWSEEVGIERHTIGYRIRRGWSVEDALTIRPSASNTTIMGRNIC